MKLIEMGGGKRLLSSRPAGPTKIEIPTRALTGPPLGSAGSINGDDDDEEDDDDGDDEDETSAEIKEKVTIAAAAPAEVVAAAAPAPASVPKIVKVVKRVAASKK